MQSQLKVLAPVITRDVTLPNTSKKVPMVMVHVPDSKTMMAIPLHTLSQMNNPTASTSSAPASFASTSTSPSADDVQQAKDLLNWTDDGIGKLDGCDMRFKINQLGCLELIDSDDETYGENLAKKQRLHPPHTQPSPYLHQQQHCQDHDAPIQRHVQDSPAPPSKLKDTTTNSSSATSSNNTSSSSNNTTFTNGTSNSGGCNSTSSSAKKSSKAKQISPGSSLLRDGPDIRRSRASSSATTPTPSHQTNVISNNNNKANSAAPQTKRHESIQQQSLLLEKLIPKEKIDEIKMVVENWSAEDVRNFVDSIPGCSGNGQLFESQQICGKSLMYLDQRDLVDIIHLKLGPAIKVYNAISMIKSL